MAHVTIDDYVADDDGDRVANAEVCRYLDQLDENLDQARGLLLIGPPRARKTLLACAVLVEVVARTQKTVAFVTLESYLRKQREVFDLEDAWMRSDDKDVYLEWKRADAHVMGLGDAVDVLVVDDVGKEHHTDTRFAVDEFDFLVRNRFDRGLTTIITTGISLQHWPAIYGPSMFSFVAELCEIVPVVPPPAWPGWTAHKAGSRRRPSP